MRRFILLCTSLSVMVLLVSASPVRALGVYVSRSGIDLADCTSTNPCRTFQGALNKYPGTRRITCIDSSDEYGPVTITASIIIDCGTGNIGTIVSNAGSAITINAAAGATIILRHLALDGNGSATDGINASSFPSGKLIVEDCTISGFANGAGINFRPTSGRGTLDVSNTQISANVNGIYVAPSTNQIASVTLDHVKLSANSGNGLWLSGAGVVAGTMRNSVAATNGVNGVVSDAHQAYFTVEESSMVANLQYGIRSISSGTSIKVGASTIGGNGTSVKAVTGSIVTFGNNQISDNGTDGSFTSTAPLR